MYSFWAVYMIEEGIREVVCNDYNYLGLGDDGGIGEIDSVGGELDESAKKNV